MELKRGQDVSLVDFVNLTDITFRLKDGESKKVVLISDTDYVEVPSHNSFENNIYPQPCLLLTEDECPYCVASRNGYESLAVKKRFKFAFYSVEENKIMVWEGTYGQGKKLIKEIQGFKDDIEYGTIFEFKRTGNKTETSYGLTPIAERKYSSKDKEIITTCKDLTIEDKFFTDVCKPKSRNLAIGLLYEMGVPVTELFADAKQILDDYQNQTKETDISTII